MPVLSRFYGIVIRMYYLQSEHNPPHIHAIYNDDVAAINFMTGEILEGYLPPKALAMVREWVTIHRATLQEIWSTQEFNTENRLKYSFQSVFNAVPALHFRDDKVSIAKIRLVPITVSQLKCALHILIGDWYKKIPPLE